MEVNNFNINRRSDNSAIGMILTLIYPLGAFLFALRDIRLRSSFWIIFIFFLLYGLCFTATYEPEDSFRYVESFYQFSTNPSANFHLAIQDFFSADSSEKDIFIYALFYLTNILAGKNYHVFFFLVSLVFSSFFLLSFRFLTNDENFRNTWPFHILALLFFLSNPIFNINGVRFWTATWIAVYGTFQLLVNKKYVHVIWILITPLVHGAFYIYIVFFSIAFLVRNWKRVLPFIFFISFFVTDVALNLLPNFTDYLPSFIQNMIWSYTQSDLALNRMAGEDSAHEALYARILMALPRYLHLGMIYLLFKERNHFEDNTSVSILGFMLALGSLVNMSSMIPSMLRYWNILIPFIAYLWAHNYQAMSKYNWVLKISMLIYLYPTFRIVRKMFWTTDPLLVLTNSVHIIINSLS